MANRVRIVLHGFLGKRFGRKHYYFVDSTADAYKALRATLPGFERAFLSFPHRYAIVADGRGLHREESHLPVMHEIHVVPVGPGSGKVIKIVAGLVIAAVGAWFGQAWAVKFGLALVISGVSDFLTKKPDTNIKASSQDSEKVESYFFRGTINTTEQGVPVPVCYGDVFCGSVVASTGIRTYDTTTDTQSLAPPETAPIPVDEGTYVPINPSGQTGGNYLAIIASGGLVSYGWKAG